MIKKKFSGIKSQSAIEFIMLLGFFMFFFMAFFFVIQTNITDKLIERQNLNIKEIALTVQDEINLASESTEGYYREFTLPKDLGGLDYNINITSSMVYLKSVNNRYSIALPIQETIGEINIGKNSIRKVNGQLKLNSQMEIQSNFSQNGLIPSMYTCDGANVNPPINITNIPNNTQSFVLIIEDLDLVEANNPEEYFSQWIVWNITNLDNNISVNSIPNPSVQGPNNNSAIIYHGPCPPVGSNHRYSFKLYSLDTNITISQGSNKALLKTNIQDHITDMSEYIGTYKR
jgi:Raf kinase inhibitor-like YbhB/YbcL family protein